MMGSEELTTGLLGLYTDESPGLKVDPVVVLVLSLVFIFSVVALHSMFNPLLKTAREGMKPGNANMTSFFAVIAKLTRKFSS